MAIFEKFPYTNLHNLNLDWMINKMKEFQEGYEDQLEQIQAVQTATEELQRALQEDEGNLADAVRALDAAIDALPADVRTEVSTYVDANLGSVVAAQLDDVVAEQLPAELSHQIAGQVSDWLEENLSDPPLDPTMTIRGAVPDAKDTGDLFRYLTGETIEGYSKDLGSALTTGTKGQGVWTSTGGFNESSLQNFFGRYVTGLTGGTVIKMSNFDTQENYFGPTAAVFVRDFDVNAETQDVIQHIKFTGPGNIFDYKITTGIYEIPVPIGANAILVNQPIDDTIQISVQPFTNDWKKDEEGPDGVAYTLVSEGSGDYSIADTTLAELRADLATNVKNVELVYPSTYGTATVIGYRTAGAQGEDLVVLRADGKAVSYSVTEQGSDLYLQQVSVSKNIFDTSTGVILDATTGTGGTYELDGESIASLTSLAEEGTPVWISWPATGTDQNLSQVVGWDIQTSSFGMTCIDGEGNYRKLSAVDGTDTVVLTVNSTSTIEYENVTAAAVSGTSNEWTTNISWSDFNTKMTNGIIVNILRAGGIKSVIAGAGKISTTIWAVMLFRVTGTAGDPPTLTPTLDLCTITSDNDGMAYLTRIRTVNL